MLKRETFLLSCTLLISALHLHAMETEETELPTALVENTQAAFTPFSGAITGSKVRMRVHPSLEAHVVRETAQGEMFAVLGETADYYAILPSKGTKGYVFRTFILDGIVEADRVNVRLYPDIEAPVVGQLSAGNTVISSVSDINNKWLEIDLPENSRFYIAKEYVENKGGIDLIAKLEKKRLEAAHHLSAASVFAQAEIQKPFEQIDFDGIQENFAHISQDYSDLPNVVSQVRESTALLQDIYVQKKIAFLEGKAGTHKHSAGIATQQLNQLAKLGMEIPPQFQESSVTDVAAAASKTLGLASTQGDGHVTDKMLMWQPLEESLYNLWAVTNSGKNIEEFYQEEGETATVLTGIVEPYSRPVKNRPGDFLLRNERMPIAFLYSTRVNLEKFVGQKVTLMVAPRPNHNFAFPAYFVIQTE